MSKSLPSARGIAAFFNGAAPRFSYLSPHEEAVIVKALEAAQFDDPAEIETASNLAAALQNDTWMGFTCDEPAASGRDSFSPTDHQL